MIKKVMLIKPPILIEKTDTYEESYGAMIPLGLGYIAASLEERGFEVKILDAVVAGFEYKIHDHGIFFRVGLSWPAILQRVHAFAPDLIGISCMFTKNYRSAYSLAKLLRETVSNNVPLVAGGVHATVMPQHVLENSPFDFVLKGEAEESFLQLIYALNGGPFGHLGTAQQDKVLELSQVDGLVYWHERVIKENVKQHYASPLDILPYPAWHKMDVLKYAKINRPYGQVGTHPRQSPAYPIITTRSCKARCVFCETWKVMGPRVRLRQPRSVLCEIESLVDVYGCKELLILDDNILVDTDRAEELFDGLIGRNWGLTWKPMNGIALWSMNETLMYKMRDSGCYQVSLAVESGNKRVLKSIIGKPLDLDIVPKYVKLAKKLGFETIVLFVIGFPGESKEDIQDTIRFAEQLDADQVVFSIATPFPGTKLHDICKEKGYIQDLDLERLRFGMASIETPDFTPDYLKKVRRDAWVRINYTRRGLLPPN